MGISSTTRRIFSATWFRTRDLAPPDTRVATMTHLSPLTHFNVTVKSECSFSVGILFFFYLEKVSRTRLRSLLGYPSGQGRRWHVMNSSLLPLKDYRLEGALAR
ncbi:hypothetical protein TNCV_328721 [Trichonephila clavipes]|nr:hypothetical protein TNCV_328721 [Trichonephila clavipes]